MVWRRVQVERPSCSTSGGHWSCDGGKDTVDEGEEDDDDGEEEEEEMLFFIKLAQAADEVQERHLYGHMLPVSS